MPRTQARTKPICRCGVNLHINYLRVSGIFSNSLVPIVYFKQASSLKVFKKEGENYKNVHAELGSL